MADQTEIAQTLDVDSKTAEGDQMDLEPALQSNGTDKPIEDGAEKSEENCGTQEAAVEPSDPASSKRSREGEEGGGSEEGENGAAKKHKSEISAEELEDNEQHEAQAKEDGQGAEDYGEEGEEEGGEGEGHEEVHEEGHEEEHREVHEEEHKEGHEEVHEEGHEEGYDEAMEEVKEGEGPADVPAKEVAPVNLGPKVFKTSVEMFDYFIKLLHYWPPNVDVNKYEFMVLTDLIKKGHPDPEKKNGIRAFQVRFHPMWQSRCFFIMREDGHCDDFSFRKCVDKILPLPPHMKANAGNTRSGGHHSGSRGSGGSGSGSRGGRGGRFRGRGRGRRGGFRN